MPRLRFSFLVLTFSLLAGRASAHFPFVLPEADGSKATVVLSETLAVDESVKTDRLAGGLKLSLRDAAGQDAPLAATTAAHSMTVPLTGSGTRTVHGVADFGVRQRGDSPAYLLVYYPKAILGDAFDAKTVVGKGVPIELIPAKTEKGIRFRLVADGKPFAGQEVKIIHPDAGQSTQKTDADGYTESFAQPGRYGAWARHWVDAAGKRGEQAYTQERRYATLVAEHAAATAKTASAVQSPSIPVATPFAKLAEPVSSFGAATLDGWLYVYGGHTATTHDYSTATVSGKFRRLNLKSVSGGSEAKWEDLPGGPILQGMNLVAHRGAIYRAGGMAPRNAPGQPKDNHSTAEVAKFDPAVGRWEQLPPAPTPRSSHDVAVVGDRLYLLGGWEQRGKEKSVWPSHADVLDLSAPEKGWTKLEQPFVRRALIVTTRGHEVFVIGGFDDNNQSQLDVDVLDTRTGTWRKGPPLPGERRNGFGPAACTVDGNVYASVVTGELFRLSADGGKWELHSTNTPRAVHRLIPDGQRILIVGGAAKQKMVDMIETVPAR
jgi:hypothetical protein